MLARENKICLMEKINQVALLTYVLNNMCLFTEQHTTFEQRLFRSDSGQEIVTLRHAGYVKIGRVPHDI